MKTKTITKLMLCLLVLLVTQNNMAVARSSKAQTERAFSVWLKGPLWQKARAQNISNATFLKAIKPVKLNWSLPDLRPPGQKKRRKPPVQSEFRAPGGYFKARSLNFNIREGRKQLVKWRHSLDKIERRYGVPREIIIAIWGKETAFGRARLPYSAIEVLATQAFMGRRKALFERELLAALTILQQNHIRARAMKSAWAGALGHPQFMPTAFLKYAVDFDGDGSKNIWSSVPDALASIANFLNQNGWEPARRWGFEVQLPANISCTLEGPDQRIKTLNWRQRGMRRVDGRPFAQADLSKHSFLLLPAGRFGPRFLVSQNFYVLKSYNESDVYALFVGHVADRMKAGSKFQRGWARLSSFSRVHVKAAQLKLEKSGADVGGADGLIGYKTRTSIGNWQSKNGFAVTCFPNKAILAKISN